MHKLFDFALEPRLPDTEELYVRHSGEELSFDTYFNAIPIAKIKKYMAITELIFEFEAEGSFEADIHTEHKKLAAQTFDTRGKIAISNTDIPDGSMLLFPVVKAKKLYRITVFAESESISAISCALIICTFKREEYVRKNVNYLVKNLSRTTDYDCKTIAVDNGRTLKNSDFSDDITLILNPNTGGSGGFGRGMKEAVKIGGFTHLLLMDDDVEIDFVALQKTLSFLKFIRPEYADISISGSMLYLDKPTCQFEAGGHFYENGTQKGFGHFLDLSKRENLVLNEADNDINYGGWWYMCMPIKYAQEGNFPLPFFLKYDDVEYALRCKQRIITLSGVGIWHEKFENKYNSSSEYYNTRNYLHLCSLHCKDFTAAKAKRIVSDKIKAKNDRQQYRMAEAVQKGYEDYLKGIDWLEHLDHEANHREICKLNYKFISYDEIEKQYGVRPRDNTFYHTECRAMLNALLPRGWIFTDVFQDTPEQYHMIKYAVHCDCERNAGYVTQSDTLFSLFIKCRLFFSKGKINMEQEKNMPFVSIVVPIYNVEKYVKKCIQSCQKQTLKNIEIICVDDGSTDGSLAIVKSLAERDLRIKCITKDNAGYGNTLNVGFDNACGEYIAIAESDDYIDSDMCEVLYTKAKQYDVDVIKSDYYTFRTRNRKVYTEYESTCGELKYYNRVLVPQSTTEMFTFQMNTWTGLYRREFIERNHIRHNETPGAAFQDNGFWFQTLSLAKSVMFVNRAFYHYRQDNPNSSINSKGKVFCMNEEFEFIHDFMESHKEVKENFMYQFFRKKFYNYMHTYSRIAEEFKLPFLERFAQELRQMQENKEINLAKIPDRWAASMCSRIADDYKMFYYEDTIYRLNQARDNAQERLDRLEGSNELAKGRKYASIIKRLIGKA